MSDEVAKQFEVQQPETPQTGGRSVSLTVTLHPNNQIEFNLPNNKILSHGLLGATLEQMIKLAVMAELQTLAKSANGSGLAGLLKKLGRG